MTSFNPLTLERTYLQIQVQASVYDIQKGAILLYDRHALWEHHSNPDAGVQSQLELSITGGRTALPSASGPRLRSSGCLSVVIIPSVSPRSLPLSSQTNCNPWLSKGSLT